MTVSVEYMGNAGNRLFQFAAGTLIAEQLGRRLIADPIDGFHLTFPASGQSCAGDPVLVRDFAGFRSSRERIIAEGLPVRLKGYFQDAAHLAPLMPELRRRIHCTSGPMVTAGPDDLLINLRLGDYTITGRHWRTLPLRFLDHYCRMRRWARIYVVTDEPDHRTAQLLASRHGARILHGTPGEDFETVRHARNILISSSSFSWWAAMLSDADRIFFPRLANWSPWSVYEPGHTPPAERLFMRDDRRLVGFPRSRLFQLKEFILFLYQLDPGYRTRYFSHWRWMVGNCLRAPSGVPRR